MDRCWHTLHVILMLIIAVMYLLPSIAWQSLTSNLTSNSTLYASKNQTLMLPGGAFELGFYSRKWSDSIGLALLRREDYSEAVKQLEKALDLGRGGMPGNYMVEEIWQELAKARYTIWEHAAMVRHQQQPDLKEYCESLMTERYDKRVRQTKESAEPSCMDDGNNTIYINDKEDHHMRDDSVFQKTHTKMNGDQRRIALLSQLSEDHQERLRVLSEVFLKASKNDRPVEVPDYLCCKITMDIFRDPVITPSGVTYERAVLYEHLRKVGKFDPLTRTTLYPEQVVPNLALKEAVQAFLAEHGWAYKPS